MFDGNVWKNKMSIEMLIKEIYLFDPPKVFRIVRID